VLWLDGAQDPGNVGAVLRVAAAFALAGALVSEGGADPMGEKALRSSAGLALRVPFARGSPAALAGACRAARRSVIALEAGGEDLLAWRSVPERPVLVVGREGSGLSTEATAAADRRVGIPLADGVDSLNVAVATGIAVAFLVRVAGTRP
jgi:TrmH family RNA methyltransferase